MPRPSSTKAPTKAPGRIPSGLLRARPTERHSRVTDDGRVLDVVDVRQRFGGVDLGATIAGTLAALGATVLLGGIAASIGTVGYQLDVERGTDTLSAGGLAAGLVILVASFLIGGWVAGRIARYDGGTNGMVTASWFIVLAAVLAAAGAWLGDSYDVFRDLPVPQWFDGDAGSGIAVATGVIAAVVMLVAGYVGGTIGTRYHERADAYLAAQERDLLTHDEPLDIDIDDHDQGADAGRAEPVRVVDGPAAPSAAAEEIDLRDAAVRRDVDRDALRRDAGLRGGDLGDAGLRDGGELPQRATAADRNGERR